MTLDINKFGTRNQTDFFMHELARVQNRYVLFQFDFHVQFIAFELGSWYAMTYAYRVYGSEITLDSILLIEKSRRQHYGLMNLENVLIFIIIQHDVDSQKVFLIHSFKQQCSLTFSCINFTRKKNIGRKTFHFNESFNIVVSFPSVYLVS